MTELLFFVTIIFIAYAVYAALSNPGKSAPASTKQAPVQEAKPEVAAEVKAAVVAEPRVAESKSEPAPKAEAAVKQPALAEKAGNSIRDPRTGEVATIPANYRFAKRWIKDALVEEGLLDKVYKNSELDDATSAKVKNAIEALKNMEKYQA